MIKYFGVALLVVVAFLAGTLVPSAWTQQASAQGTEEFLVINYMKVPPGKGADYVTMERNFWKATHQARVRDGRMKSWALLQLQFGGTETPYSFATIDNYSRWEDINLPVQSYFEKANLGRDIADIGRQTQAAREIARQEVWRAIDHTP